MEYNPPSPSENSLIEQLETAHSDYLQLKEKRDESDSELLDAFVLLVSLWSQLDVVHGSQLIHLLSPEGKMIERIWSDAQLIQQIRAIYLGDMPDLSPEKRMSTIIRYWLRLEECREKKVHEIEIDQSFTIHRTTYFPSYPRV